MSLITITEKSFETKLVDFEYQLLNTSYGINNFIINNVETILPYMALFSLILGFLSCFLPCILCKTIKNILFIPCRCITCIICKKKKSKLNKLNIVEVNDKKQKLISA